MIEDERLQIEGVVHVSHKDEWFLNRKHIY